MRTAINAVLAPDSLETVYADWIAANNAPLAGRTLTQTIELLQDHDFAMILPMTRLAQQQALRNPNTYLYGFQWKVPRALLSSDQQELGAIHGLELPFVFGTLDLGETVVPGGVAVLADVGQRAQAQTLSQSMVNAWTNFARSGNPNGFGVPAWPIYDSVTRPTLVWRNDAAGVIDSVSVRDPDATRRMAWESWDFPVYN